MKVFAIIVGAGRGRRFGGLKQFVEFQGKPLLVYTIEHFEKNRYVNSVIVVVPQRMVARTGRLVKEYRLGKVRSIVGGGERRQDSVLNGIRKIGNARGIVIVHDAVRPFVSQKLITRGIKLCQRYKAVIFGMPVFDTIKLVKGRKVVATVPRISPYAIQTPQFFDAECLMKVYEEIDFNREFTDEAAMLESIGIPVFVFNGESENIKITTKQDLKILHYFK
ncbi:MAG: 2-C-methyl-D-erythritol 4-phosphate cytidylyltransferase [candidate division WOR-3 bacterium]